MDSQTLTDLELVNSLLISALPSSHLKISVETAVEILTTVLDRNRLSNSDLPPHSPSSTPTHHGTTSETKDPRSYRSLLNEYCQAEKLSVGISVEGEYRDYTVHIGDAVYHSSHTRKKDAIEDACRQYLTKIQTQ